MLNKSIFLAFVIFKRREIIGTPGAGSGANTQTSQIPADLLGNRKVFVKLAKGGKI